MKIVSLNAWGGQVWPRLGSWVQGLNADVLNLQEMIRATEPSPPWLAYRDPYRSLNQRADLFGDVSSLLPKYAAEFLAANQGMLADTGGKTYQSQHGLGQWISPDLEIVDHVNGFVHSAFRPDGWGAEPVPRGFQAVKVKQKDRTRPVTIAHFHGLRDPNGKGDTPARAQQARAALTLLNQIATSKDDVVLSGDFNVLPDSETLKIFADWGLRDLVGTRDTRTSLYPKAGRHANYLLVSHSVNVASFDAPADPVVSDHRPLILEIS